MRSFRLLDWTFSVDTSACAEAEPEVARVLADLPTTRGPGGCPTYSVVKNGEDRLLLLDGGAVDRVSHVAAIGDVLVWSLNRETARRSRLLVVHGAAVAAEDRVVLLPGASGAGKSSLAAAMVAAGWDLLSDELIAFDLGTGLAHGTKLPINLKRGSWFLLPAERISDEVDRKPSGQLLVRPSEIGGQHSDEPGVPCALVAPRFDPSVPSRLVPMTRGGALHALAAGCMNPPLIDLGRLGAIVGRLDAFELAYDSPANGAALLEPLVAGRDVT